MGRPLRRYVSAEVSKGRNYRRGAGAFWVRASHRAFTVGSVHTTWVTHSSPELETQLVDNALTSRC